MAADRWQETSQLYHAALLRAASDRAEFLREACGGDDALRSEVESLLARDDTAQNFMNTPAAAADPRLMTDVHHVSMIGQQLGAYRVVSLLGAGGMGEVYRARDTTLGRDVAIKVLPPDFALDHDRVARFSREAQILASLNHPNIAGIHHLETTDGVFALVMELVEGETLADRIARGPIPLDDALPIARQICDALDAAHEHGIIHRDLKPANIKVRPDGAVKVLDFGLAKSLDHTPAASTLSMSPTMNTPGMTGKGVLLGTAAYMAPEQAKGRPADKRCDIWAFGCVLFEMLTGRPTFPGSDASEVLAGIIKSEPDWKLLPPSASASLQSLLRRCLQKDPKQRLRDIGDARLTIDDVLASAGRDAAQPAIASRHGRIAWIAAVVFLLSTVTLSWLGLRPATPLPMQLLSILPPDGVSIDFGSGDFNHGTLAVSPDGRQLAFTPTSAGKRMLWIRALDSATATPLAGTEGALLPFWSPDGRAIGFFAQGKLGRIAVSGGPVQILADVTTGYGGTWSREGVILFARGQFDVLYRVSASGGSVTTATSFDRSTGESAHRFPTFLPDGHHFLYGAVADNNGRTWIKVGTIDSAETTPLVPDPQAVNAAYIRTPAGEYVLFARQQTVFAQRFDSDNRVVNGDPIQVSEVAVAEAERAAFAVFSTSASGLIAYIPGAAPDQRELVWVDRTGKPTGRVGGPASYEHVELSPDGKRVAIDRTDPQSNKRDIWLVEVGTGTPTRFTFEPSQYNTPRWSPDGSRLVFARVGDRKGIYQKLSDGGGPEEQLLAATHDGLMLANDWSRDGKSMVFLDGPPGLAARLWLLLLSGDRRAVVLPNTEISGLGRFSPDGRWLAYQSRDSGRVEIYVQPLPASGAKWQVSRDGGARPRWRRDGKELYFIAANGTLMATPIAAAQTFQAGVPIPLFQIRYAGLAAQYPYDVSPDGQRFLVISPVENRQVVPVTILLNWRPQLAQN